MIRELILRDLSLWDCLWQSLVFLVLGLAAGWWLRRRPSRAYAVLLVAMSAAALVPFLSAVVRHSHLGVFAAQPPGLAQVAPNPPEPLPLGVAGTPPALEISPPTVGTEPGQDPAPRTGLPWRAILLSAWLAATLLLLTRLIAMFVYGARLVQQAQRSGGEEIQRVAERMASRLRLASGPQIRASDRIHSPVVWCWTHPPILLVPRVAGQSEVEWAGIVVHELAHCKRRDHATGLAAELAASLLPWNPLMWVARRLLIRLGEQACDDWVVASGQSSEDYAQSLLHFRPQKQMAFWPAVVSSKGGLAHRIRRILNDACGNPHAGVKWALALSIAAISVGVGVAFAQTRPASSTAPAQPVEEAAPSLHQGAATEDKDEVQKLLAQGADINARDKYGNTPLHYAARNSNAKNGFVEFLIAKGADVNARNNNGQTPLHLAVQVVRKRVIATANTANVLLAHGAQVDAKDENGCTPLYIACGVFGWTNTVEVLLAKGAKINAKTNDGLTPLHRAAMLGRTDVVETLLRWMGRGNEALRDASGAALPYGSVLDSRDVRGNTALHYAAIAGASNIVERLVSNDADVDSRNTRGQTPVHLAVMHNRQETVKLLLSKGAEVSSIQVAAYVGDLAKVKSFIEKGVSVEAQDGSGLTPLHAAAGAGQKEMVEFLIGRGAPVNAGAVAEGPGTPLHYAIDGGSGAMTELLLQKGARVNEGNQSGMTPLHLATAGNKKNLVQLLLANQADVNAKDKRGEIPLHLAAYNKDKDVAQLLIDKGANIDARSDKTEGTPLLYAARFGNREVTKLLVDKGATLSELDVLLSCACRDGYRDLAELFIQKGANVNTEAWGYAPSLETVWQKHPDVLKLLLDHGANPNAKDRDGWSLLHYTVDPLCRSLEMTRMLLDKGANPNIKLGVDGSSPFEWAAYYGLKETVELLLAKGADVNAQDNEGHTALSEAKKYGHNETVELLRQHGARE